ncbi:MAG: hypothetical protein H0X37_08110 [Herpetosiphonaceae bacterium]|nr:hypothetical protein [Herpetosiphonaceae bacterium]
MNERPIRGEGIANEQDYIEERLEDAGDVKDYARAGQQLKQEEQEIERLESQIETKPGNTNTRNNP